MLRLARRTLTTSSQHCKRFIHKPMTPDEMINLMQHRTTKKYNIIIEDLLSQNKVSSAIELIDNFIPNKETKFILTKYMAQAGHEEEALKLFEKNETVSSASALAMAAILNSLLQGGHTQRALTIFKNYKNYPECCNVFIEYYLAIDDHHRAREVYATCHTKNHYTFTLMLHYYIKQHRYDEAKLIWDNLVKNPNLMTITSVNIMISGLCSIGRVEMAENVLKHYEIEPNIYTFTPVIKYHYRNGNRERAEMWVYRMVSKHNIFPDQYLLDVFDNYYKRHLYALGPFEYQLKMRGVYFNRDDRERKPPSPPIEKPYKDVDDSDLITDYINRWK